MRKRGSPKKERTASLVNISTPSVVVLQEVEVPGSVEDVAHEGGGVAYDHEATERLCDDVKHGPVKMRPILMWSKASSSSILSSFVCRVICRRVSGSWGARSYMAA